MEPFPRAIGVAADLVFIETPRVFLSNCLAVYDTVMLPIDAITLNRLLIDFDVDGFRQLVESGRIELCPSYTITACHGRDEDTFSKEAFLTSLLRNPLFEEWPEYSLIERLITDHMIVPMTASYGQAKSVLTEAERGFIHTARQPGYEALDINRQTGLRMGMARINDLLEVGYGAMELDAELPILLSCAYPGRTQTPPRTSADILAPLHRISNLPDIGTLAAQEKWDDKKLLKVLLSEEGANLRAWLRESMTSELDVRDAYIAVERDLPSRKKWLGWMRFGTISTVSSVVSALITKDPVASAFIGAGVGAIDQAWGARALDATTQHYHPAQWLSFVSRERVRGP